MDEDVKMARATQKALNRLISEEIVAADIYKAAINAVKPDDRKFIEKKFSEIAADEIEDHWKSLVKFAVENEFEVPFKPKEIEKHASGRLMRILDTLKRGEDATYYIGRAIESEHEAIGSFEAALADEDLPYELQPTLLKCYYDEIQHLDDLTLLARCAEIGVEVNR